MNQQQGQKLNQRLNTDITQKTQIFNKPIGDITPPPNQIHTPIKVPPLITIPKIIIPKFDFPQWAEPRTKRVKVGKRKGRYTPSLLGVSNKIYGKKTGKYYTGLTIRPIARY
jgi:hypothetical protein